MLLFFIVKMLNYFTITETNSFSYGVLLLFVMVLFCCLSWCFDNSFITHYTCTVHVYQLPNHDSTISSHKAVNLLVSEVIIISIINPIPLFLSLFCQSYPLIFPKGLSINITSPKYFMYLMWLATSY